jgi:hypothetical protein
VPDLRLLAVAALVALAGCGGGHTSGGDAPATAVTLIYSVGSVVKTNTLDCATPSANDKPTCDLLKKLPASAFEPVPKDQMCTMIYGGPEKATIKGTVNGKKVDASYNRTNGCEIDRYKKVEPLFAELAGN